jgi:hypothetical protein
MGGSSSTTNTNTSSNTASNSAQNQATNSASATAQNQATNYAQNQATTAAQNYQQATNQAYNQTQQQAYNQTQQQAYNQTQQQAYNQQQQQQQQQNSVYNSTSGPTAAALALIQKSLGPISQDQIQQYLSPYTQQVINSTVAQQQQNNAVQQQALKGNAISQGALGGDRAKIAQAELMRSQGLNDASTISNLYNTGYGQALTAAQADRAAALQAAGMMGTQASGTSGTTGTTTGATTGTSTGATAGTSVGTTSGTSTGTTAGTSQALTAGQSTSAQNTATTGSQNTASALYNQASTAGAQAGSGTSNTTGTGTSTTETNPGMGGMIGTGLSTLALFSDRRVKDDVQPVGKSFDGQTIYKFRYKGDPTTHIGLMAQDVEHHHPEAVGNHGGVKTVNYDMATRDAAEKGHFADGGLVRRDLGGPISMQQLYTPPPQQLAPLQFASAQPMQMSSPAPAQGNQVQDFQKMYKLGENARGGLNNLLNKMNGGSDWSASYEPTQSGLGGQLASMGELASTGAGKGSSGLADGGTVPTASAPTAQAAPITFSNMPAATAAPATVAQAQAAPTTVALPKFDNGPVGGATPAPSPSPGNQGYPGDTGMGKGSTMGKGSGGYQQQPTQSQPQMAGWGVTSIPVPQVSYPSGSASTSGKGTGGAVRGYANGGGLRGYDDGGEIGFLDPGDYTKEYRDAHPEQFTPLQTTTATTPQDVSTLKKSPSGDEDTTYSSRAVEPKYPLNEWLSNKFIPAVTPTINPEWRLNQGAAGEQQPAAQQAPQSNERQPTQGDMSVGAQNAYNLSNVSTAGQGQSSVGNTNNGIGALASAPDTQPQVQTQGIKSPAEPGEYTYNPSNDTWNRLGEQPAATPTAAPQVTPTAPIAPTEPGKFSKKDIVNDMVSTFRAGGANDNSIRGILRNVNDESRFDPTSRHPDQPRWSGEAHYAHGLFQEGGQEWNNYDAWLKKEHPGADWRDHKLQSEFLVQNLKDNYPQVWDKMQNGTPEEASQAFLHGYLKPRADLAAARHEKYGQGTPTIEDFANGAKGTVVRSAETPPSEGIGALQKVKSTVDKGFDQNPPVEHRYTDKQDAEGGGLLQRVFGFDFNPLGLTKNERMSLLSAGATMMATGNVGQGILAGANFQANASKEERQAQLDAMRIKMEMFNMQKPQVIGEYEQNGVTHKLYGVPDFNTGQWKPMSPGQQGVGPTSAPKDIENIPDNVSGEDFMKQAREAGYSAADIDTARQVAEYKSDPNKLMSLKGDRRVVIDRLAHRFNPDYDQGKYQAVVAAEKSLAAGPVSKALTAGGRLADEADQIMRLADDTHNTKSEYANRAAAATWPSGSTYSRGVTSLKTGLNNFYDTASVVAKGGGQGAEGDVKRRAESMNEFQDPETIKANVRVEYEVGLKNMQSTLAPYNTAHGYTPDSPKYKTAVDGFTPAQLRKAVNILGQDKIEDITGRPLPQKIRQQSAEQGTAQSTPSIQRPPGASDVQLRQQAEDYVRRGGDRAKTQEMLHNWGVMF